MDDHPNTCPTATPGPDVLLARAAHLSDLADRLEQSLAMRLDEPPSELARRLLERNRHQLHLAADELRDAAHRFRQRAADSGRLVGAR